jgi:ubiquinone/menaquinone biosynthesis C-methylase UbiE
MSLSLREHTETLLPPYVPPASQSGRTRYPVPNYLERYYWWAYVRPTAVRFWERQWLINLVLLGNYKKLGVAALDGLGDDLPGRTLQVSCCYGNLTPKLARTVAACGGTLDVIDILPVQLTNLRRKLWPGAPVRTLQMDATALEYPDASFDRVVLFFLLHEQPQQVRERTVREAMRVLKPGGTILIVDYAQPAKWHPVRYALLPILAFLEPFAVDLWYSELDEVLPDQMAGRTWRKTSYFGGLYQRLVSRG